MHLLKKRDSTIPQIVGLVMKMNCGVSINMRKTLSISSYIFMIILDRSSLL